MGEQKTQKEKNILKSKDFSTALFVQHKQCWRNSILALITCLDEEWNYHEGFIVMKNPIIFLEHGWCESEEEIVDVTLPEENLIYVTAVSFSYEDTYENVVNEWNIPFLQHTSSFRNSRYFFEALQQAQAVCEQHKKGVIV